MVNSALLIEDVRFTRAMNRRYLVAEIEGEVHEAADGTEALEVLQQFHDIGVVVSDISMPGMTGLDLLKMIRTGKSAAERGIPFIIISGAITDAIQSALKNLDVTAVIAKPVRKDDLVKHLRRIGEGSSTVDQFLQSEAEYDAVEVKGLLEADVPDDSPTCNRFDDLDHRIRFLETVPALEGMDLDSLSQLAGWAEVLQFSEGKEIDLTEFENSRLLVIAWGAAEVLRTTRSSRIGTMEHRIDLLEADDLVGVAAFMSLPGLGDLSQFRTTRPTVVLAFNFANADNDAELEQLRDKLKVSVGHTLGTRLAHRDEVIAETLAERLAETAIKRTAGGYVIMTGSALAIYTLTMRALLDLELKGAERGIASVVMVLVAVLPFLITVRTGPFKFADLGLTLKGARGAVVEAVVLSSILLVGLIGLKFLIVTVVPAYQVHSVFELAQTFVRPGTTGGIDSQFYAINIGVYALFVPIQEVVVRCGLQSMIREFLYGSDLYRTVVAILVSNLFFAASHAHLNVGIAVATFIGGLFWGWLFHRRRSIVGVSVSHIMIGGMALFGLGLETFIR